MAGPITLPHNSAELSPSTVFCKISLELTKSKTNPYGSSSNFFHRRAGLCLPLSSSRLPPPLTLLQERAPKRPTTSSAGSPPPAPSAAFARQAD